MIARILKPLAGWKGYALAAGVAAAVGFGGGWSLRDLIADKATATRDKLDAQAKAKAAQTVLRGAIEDVKTGDAIGRASAERQVQIRTVTQEIVREVPVYVTVEADRACPVPVGLVRLHDAAAAGVVPAVPDAAAAPHDAPSGVALSSVSATVAENYGRCLADQERLSALQQWVRDMAANWARDP